MTPASATTSDCDAGDAPAAYETEDCQDLCSQSGSEWVCDIRELCDDTDPASAWIVATFGSSGHALVGFGECTQGASSTPWCCTFDEDSGDVDTVTLRGNDKINDPLAFSWEIDTPDEENLEPWDDDEIDAYIYGEDLGDDIRGSNYQGSDFQEYLYGQLGDDLIVGHADGDYISGGGGDDEMYGGGDNDRMHGNCGDDLFHGGPGNDTMCDDTGSTLCASGCATPDAQLFEGGAGNDAVWYDLLFGCSSSVMDSNSNLNGGSDVCGDSDHWSQMAGELPQNCVPGNTEPAKCSAP